MNGILRHLHPDVASLCRYLVGEEPLDRKAGVDWRAGGRVAV